MSILVRDIKTEFKEFWNLPILKDSCAYNKTIFDSINASLILDRLTEDTAGDDLVLVMPPDPSGLLLVVIESLLSLLKLDVLKSSRDVLNNIKPGDAVGLVNERIFTPGTYEGTEIVNGRVIYLVQTRDSFNSKYGLTEKEKWKIQPYITFENDKRKRKTSLAGKVLEKLYELPPGGLLAFQKSKIIVVTGDKNELVDQLRNIQLGDSYLEDVFPIANYISADNWQPVGRNRLRRSPVLCLTSAMDVASDLARKDPEASLVILDGAGKIRSGYGSIGQLNADKTLRKIICLLRTQDEEEIKTLAAMGFDSWVWRRDDFRGVSVPETIPDKEHIFARHQAMLNGLSGNSPEYLNIDIPEALQKTIDDVRQTLLSLNEQIGDSRDSGFVMQKSYSFYNSLLQLSSPVNAYDEFVENQYASKEMTFAARYDFLVNDINNLFGITLDSNLKPIYEKYLTNVKVLFEAIKSVNPKYERIKTLMQESPSDPIAFVCSSNEQSGVLSSMFDDPRIKFLAASSAGIEAENNVVITGWLNRRISARLLLAPYAHVRYLFYPREFGAYGYMLATHPASEKSTLDKKLRSIYDTVRPDMHPESEGITQNLDDLFDRIKAKFGYQLDHAYDYQSGKTVEAKRVVFENDSFIYAGSGTKLVKLDRSSNSIRKLHLDEIQVGDELIFANNNRDMFEDLLALLKTSFKYAELWQKTNIWRDALLKYSRTVSTNPAVLARELAEAGCKRLPITVASWMEGNIIGPPEDNYAAIYAIMRMTRDEALSVNIESVVRSCRELHALHVSAGRELIRRIIRSTVFAEDSDLNPETRDRISEYAKSARVETVVYIDPENHSIAMQFLGKLLQA